MPRHGPWGSTPRFERTVVRVLDPTMAILTKQAFLDILKLSVGNISLPSFSILYCKVFRQRSIIVLVFIQRVYLYLIIFVFSNTSVLAMIGPTEIDSSNNVRMAVLHLESRLRGDTASCNSPQARSSPNSSHEALPTYHLQEPAPSYQSLAPRYTSKAAPATQLPQSESSDQPAQQNVDVEANVGVAPPSSRGGKVMARDCCVMICISIVIAILLGIFLTLL